MSNEFDHIVDTKPVESIDLCVEFENSMTLAEEMMDLIEQMDVFAQSFEIYSEIVNAIDSIGGVDASLEHMFGENFSSSESMHEEASLEAEGFISKIINTVKEFFRKLWAWFQSILKGNDGVIEALKEAMNNIDKKTNIFPLKVNHKFLYENGWVNRIVTSTFAGVEQQVDQDPTKVKEGIGAKIANVLNDNWGREQRTDIVNQSAEGDTLFGGAFIIENAEQFKNACTCLIQALTTIKSSEQSFKRIEGEIEQQAATEGKERGAISKKVLTAKAWARIRIINARVRAGAMYLVNRAK